MGASSGQRAGQLADGRGVPIAKMLSAKSGSAWRLRLRRSVAGVLLQMRLERIWWVMVVLNQRVRRELRHPNRSWRVDETYLKAAGNWAYLYRAVDSAGETIEFMLSPKRDWSGEAVPAAGAIQRAGPRCA
jgi:hypothetical protein